MTTKNTMPEQRRLTSPACDHPDLLLDVRRVVELGERPLHLSSPAAHPARQAAPRRTGNKRHSHRRRRRRVENRGKYVTHQYINRKQLLKRKREGVRRCDCEESQIVRELPSNPNRDITAQQLLTINKGPTATRKATGGPNSREPNVGRLYYCGCHTR